MARGPAFYCNNDGWPNATDSGVEIARHNLSMAAYLMGANEGSYFSSGLHWSDLVPGTPTQDLSVHTLQFVNLMCINMSHTALLQVPWRRPGRTGRTSQTILGVRLGHTKWTSNCSGEPLSLRSFRPVQCHNNLCWVMCAQYGRLLPQSAL